MYNTVPFRIIIGPSRVSAPLDVAEIIRIVPSHTKCGRNHLSGCMFKIAGVAVIPQNFGRNFLLFPGGRHPILANPPGPNSSKWYSTYDRSNLARVVPLIVSWQVCMLLLSNFNQTAVIEPFHEIGGVWRSRALVLYKSQLSMALTLRTHNTHNLLITCS